MTYRIEGRRARATSGVAVVAIALALASCGSGGQQAQGKGGRRGQQSGPATVGYVVAQSTSAINTVELSGRTVAFQSSEVRPQVSGVLQRRFFTEGSIVRQGQPLYQIDPSLYRAAANEAQANVANSRAQLEAARVLAERYKPLAEIEAVSKQDYTNAIASQKQAAAQIDVNRAQLDTARVNLRFTTVPAPITGRIGRSLFTVGALVSATQTNPLATIQQLDPMFVDIQQSAAELLRLRRALASGGASPATATVHLALEDGSDYGRTGTVEFAEVVVDQTSGTVTLRARFPNPDGLLLPGMFVRARFPQSIQRNAILVPQQAVTRDAKGNATVWLVGQGDKARQRSVTTSQTQGAYWVVTNGLQPGEKIITQGTANLQDGAAIKPVAANAPLKIVPPSQQQGGAGGQSKAG